MITVYIGATMDLFHVGHLNLINKAKQMGDRVVVVLNSDEFVERFKGRRPIIPLNQRLRIVAAIKGVDIVDVNESEDCTDMMLRYRANIILHGDDYTPERYLEQTGLTKKFLEDNRIEIVSVPYSQENSSTNIKKQCTQEK